MRAPAVLGCVLGGLSLSTAFLAPCKLSSRPARRSRSQALHMTVRTRRWHAARPCPASPRSLKLALLLMDPYSVCPSTFSVR